MENKKIGLKEFGWNESAIKLAEELNDINNPKISRKVRNFLAMLNCGIHQIIPMMEKSREMKRAKKSDTKLDIGFVIFNAFYKYCLDKTKEDFGNLKYINSVVTSRFRIQFRRILRINSKWARYK